MKRITIKTITQVIGTQKKVADILGVKQPTIHKWINKDRTLSAEHAILIEKATKGVISRKGIRPDIFDSS